MYNNQIMHACGKAKKKALDRIEQKFHVKIPAAVRIGTSFIISFLIPTKL